MTNKYQVANGSDMCSRDKATYDPGDVGKSPSTPQQRSVPPRISTTASAGPGALPTPDPASPIEADPSSGEQLKFHFAPNMRPLLFPPIDSLPEGSDAWAFAKGYVSVTPLRADYAGPAGGRYGLGSEAEERCQPGRKWA